MSLPRLLLLDFDGTLTTNQVMTADDGRELVVSSRADGIGIRALLQAGVEVHIVSGETAPVVGVRAAKLGIPAHLGVTDKAERVRWLCRERRVFLGNVAFLGNDVPDVPALDIVGHPWVVADAHPAIRHRYPRLDAKGGHGAVRELCDRLLGLPYKATALERLREGIWQW